ncbi:polyprenyl synthetase family protein [Granulicella paludicola]|uniref:polyprenyl synthetase family protein n=1 Tax=Granulicella paludicola TaxID=474951 RepID=UPI0021DF6244|nr:polyprenyl synthetase family protein [Granulicella paludicola]
MNTDVKTILTSGAALTDAALERLLPSATTMPHSIHRAMRHSTFAGGKRLRPVLCMEAARMVAGTLPEGAADLGAALEMVHTYSLIHDDLPALDNDDLRRGQPTCHVVYGEAIAILAGDALQTLAFQTLAQLPAPAATIVAILHDFSLAIGTGVGRFKEDQDTGIPSGMIGGQVMDIEGEGQKPTADLVERIHRAKTGALITTSIVSGGLLGLTSAAHVGFITPKDATPEEAVRIRKEATETQLAEQHAKRIDTIARLRTFGEKAGLAFQIVDDILDMTQSSEQLGKTAGKDTASDKATWPAVYGIEQSEKDAAQLIADAFAALEPFGEAAAPLKALASYLVERKN